MATTALQTLLDSLSARLATVEAKLGVEGAPPPPAAPTTAETSGGGETTAKSVEAFDTYCAACLDPFVAACEDLGSPEAAACGAVVKKGWTGMRAFIAMASSCKKPKNYPGDAVPFLKACQEAAQEAGKAVTRGDWECHQKTVSEGLGCVSWLVVEPSPVDFVENFVGGQDFWANKIRVAYKKTDPKQIAFCDTFKTLMVSLMAYVKEWHKTGLTWNPKGADQLASSLAKKADEPPSKKNPAAAASSSSKMAGGLGDLKAGLGAFSTSGLKKVTKDMQTWRSEYKGEKGGAVVAKKVGPPKKTQTVAKGPPVKEFQTRGMKWFIENQTKEDGVVTVDMDPKDGPKHTVYICNCFEATIDVKGKCKGVAVDGCHKCNVLFDSAISSLEVVNSKSMKCQARGTVPSVAIDKTDGILTYLSKETLDLTQFVTSKSSDMQISFPNASGDMVEAPIPEQFVHKASLLNDKPSVSSDVSDLYSH